MRARNNKTGKETSKFKTITLGSGKEAISVVLSDTLERVIEETNHHFNLKYVKLHDIHNYSNKAEFFKSEVLKAEGEYILSMFNSYLKAHRGYLVSIEDFFYNFVPQLINELLFDSELLRYYIEDTLPSIDPLLNQLSEDSSNSVILNKFRYYIKAIDNHNRLIFAKEEHKEVIKRSIDKMIEGIDKPENDTNNQ